MKRPEDKDQQNLEFGFLLESADLFGVIANYTSLIPEDIPDPVPIGEHKGEFFIPPARPSVDRGRSPWPVGMRGYRMEGEGLE